VKGENVHWTLERLRQAIIEEFGITLGINTIWVWLRRENRKLKEKSDNKLDILIDLWHSLGYATHRCESA
jgi:transposase